MKVCMENSSDGVMKFPYHNMEVPTEKCDQAHHN